RNIGRSLRMIELMAGLTAIRRPGLTVILAIFLTGFTTNSAPAADPAQSGEGRQTSLHSVPAHANFIIIAQWKTTTTKKESWIKKAWRNPKQKPWFFVVGGFVLLTVVVGGYYLVGAAKKKGPKLQVTEDQIGQYHLKNLLATGHTSQVWEVVDTSSRLHFAM